MEGGDSYVFGGQQNWLSLLKCFSTHDYQKFFLRYLAELKKKVALDSNLQVPNLQVSSPIH